MYRIILRMLCAALLMVSMGWAFADNIVIGQSGEFSGQALIRESTEGAQLYFDEINRQGGIRGRKIELVSLDDQRDDKKTQANTETLINDNKVVALFGYRSTPSVESIIPLLEKYQIALVAPFSGGGPLYQQPLIYNLRASYQAEAAKLVQHVATVGLTRIAILHQDDAFGKDGLAGFQQELHARNMEPVAVASYSRKDLRLDEAIKTIRASNPQTVLMACTPKACLDFIHQMHKDPSPPHLYTLSNVDSKEFFEALGADGVGVGITQVVPDPSSGSTQLAREYGKLAKANKQPLSYGGIEGFASAKLLVEALKRTGPDVTRDKLIATLNKLGEVDLGGLVVRYSAQDHRGSAFIDVSVVGSGGKLLH